MFPPEVRQVRRKLLQEAGEAFQNTTSSPGGSATSEATLLESGGSTYYGHDEMFKTAMNRSYNTTFADLGEPDTGFSDMQTVFLACIATLIPLVFALIAAIGIRFLWRRFRARKSNGYEGVLQREESSDPLAVKSLSASGNLLTDELKTSESQFSVTPAEELEDIPSHSPHLSYGGASSAGSMPNHTSKSANGSIITMTLKNNHLIVETEERGVTLDENAPKTTTTKFSTSSSPHENSVFVVEVQQGSVISGGGGSVDPPTAAATSSCYDTSNLYPKLSSSSAVSSQEDIQEGDEDDEAAAGSGAIGSSNGRSSQRAQVHRPPAEDSEMEDSANAKECRRGIGQGGSTNTGLSQSDLSISSSGSNNPSYRYGNQLGYEGGHYGYPQYVGYMVDGDDVRTVRGGASSSSGDVGVASSNHSSTAMVDAAAVAAQKRRSAPTGSSGTSAIKRASSVSGTHDDSEPNQNVRNQLKNRRSTIAISANSNRPVDPGEAEEERHLQEQKQLGQGSTKVENDQMLSVTVENGEATTATPSPVEDTEMAASKEGLHRMGSLQHHKGEDDGEDGTKGKDALSDKKRGSLPIITPDLYSQIKHTTKNLILEKTPVRPSLSPKFEKFRNEISPLEETEQKEEEGDSPSEAGKDTDLGAKPKVVSETAKGQENEAFVPSDQIIS